MPDFCISDDPVELKAALVQLDAAISDLISNKRVRSFTVGSGEFQRRYTFAETTLGELQRERKRLQERLQAVEPCKQTYRNSSFMNTIYVKGA